MKNSEGRPRAKRMLHLRVTEQEHDGLKREADQYGYELSSLLRLRIFGKRDGLRIVRKPPIEMRMLGDALGQLGLTSSELNKVGSNLNQIAKRLNQGSRDLFMLDSSLRWFERVSGNITKILEIIEASLSGKPHNKED